MLALDNDIGITGISHGAEFGFVSVIRGPHIYSVTESILIALAQLDAGDIILIEQHAPDIFPFNRSNDGSACSCNCDQHRFLPMEYWPLEHLAIQAATANGVLVVEAAGNGEQNLDHPNFGRRFQRDSGAILVGAGGPNSRAPRCSTNFGSAIDMHAWGTGIITLGGKSDDGGLIRINGDDRRQWYTPSFGGTSGASPIVAGAAAVLQGIKLQRDQMPLLPNQLSR